MLSRVADALYWMGRYIERAEHLTRLLLVTEDLSTEIQGLDEEMALAEWKDLLAIFPGSRLGNRPAPAAAAVAVPYLAAFFIDDAHPYSTVFSVRKARENARSVREALTIEVFLGLNETYRTLEAHAARGITDVPTFRAALSQTQKGLLGVVGAIEHTLTRDQGWFFLKLGEALERATRTALILNAKLPVLGGEPAGHRPLVYTRWRTVLRGLGALENYRARYGARIEPDLVLAFAVLQDDVPRSLRYGARAIQDCLEAIDKGAALTPAARIVGRFAARLSYAEAELVRRPDFGDFLRGMLLDLDHAHDAITTQYFVT